MHQSSVTAHSFLFVVLFFCWSLFVARTDGTVVWQGPKGRWPLNYTATHPRSAMDIEVPSGGAVGNYNVECGSDSFCPSSEPICCDSIESPPYCVGAGQFCCNDRYRNLRPAGCNPGETCCVPPVTSNKTYASCCKRGEVCDSNGECIPDECGNLTTLHQCGNNSRCGWCCDTFHCLGLLYGATNCDASFIFSPGTQGQCADNCTLASDSCGNCERQVDINGVPCGWCCETQTCMSKTSQTQTCSYYEFVPTGEKCGTCLQGGHGLYVSVSRQVWKLVTLTIVPSVIGFLILVVCARRCIAARRRARLAAANGGVVPIEDNVGEPDFVPQAGVVKYGFDHTHTVHVESDDDDDDNRCDEDAPLLHGKDSDLVMCSTCNSKHATTVLLPCYHSCLCHSCCKQLVHEAAASDAAKKKTKTIVIRFKKPEGLKCPMCRQKVETVVDLRRALSAAKKKKSLQ